MNDKLASLYLTNVRSDFRKYKRLAEQAIAQIGDEELCRAIDPEANSVAVVLRHISGNLRSRWTDFLTTDGEKPDRVRDTEFLIEAGATREALLKQWEDGWCCAFAAIEALQPADLARTVTIRGEPHSVVGAINRNLTHAAYHVGQIVLLAKHFKSEDWQSLSIPRGQSETFNPKMLSSKKA